VAVRDVNLGIEKTYGDILSDALTLKPIIAKALGPEILSSIGKGDEVFVGILAAGGYEFTIAVVAVLALGAAIVPMSVSVPVREASYLITKSRQPLMLVSSEVVELGASIRNFALEQGHRVSTLEILPYLPVTATYSPLQMVVSSNRRLDDNRAGVVIFTSGTTGRPKGAVMRRAYIHETALAIGEGYDIDHNDVLLHVIPVHHTTGLGTSFFAFLIAGACIEFQRGSFDAAWIWNRWLKGGLTTFSAVPTIFLRLKWYFEQELAPKLSTKDLSRFVEAANQFRAFMCGSSALQQPVQDFWTEIRRGRPILTRYGATEFPGCLKVPADAGALPKGCVGLPVPGVELKLTEGDHGELLVRSPYMFAK
jgi:malonyl-CoA/methylmalonyl-CoA synthetase